ncbi:conditioned medium-induced protein 4 [Salinigranum halophilum]|uniref:conditioned medium-induced protein 4 n=1 Tax=Salinigranum halophilum TaxID=2565931 RepID=UPI00115F57F0|nr:conditioned medium-induced protein 4 [Salinigranum halophilum]
MDEKTEELRDLFVEATGADTVTERQEAGRGSITGAERDASDERLASLVETMRERFSFRSSLGTSALVTVLRGFFADATDADLASDLDVTEDEVFTARMDLHLVTDADRTPVDNRVHRLVVADASLDECLTAVDADPTVVRQSYLAQTSRVAATRASHRFRDEFAELLTDEDLSTRLASDARRDGLKDATEDLETDVSF